MRNIFVAVLISALALGVSANAVAQQASAEVAVQDKYVDRGLVLNNNPTLVANVRLDGVVVPGVFITGEFVSTDMNINRVAGRGDIGVGYGFVIGDAFDAAVSVNRLTGTALYGDAYNEVRGEVGFGLAPSVRLFSHAAYALTASENDLYYGVGTEWQATDRLSFAVVGNAYRYEGNVNKFNNLETTVRLNVVSNLDIYAGYSTGGRDLISDSISDTYWFGAAARF